MGHRATVTRLMIICVCISLIIPAAAFRSQRAMQGLPGCSAEAVLLDIGYKHHHTTVTQQLVLLTELCLNQCYQIRCSGLHAWFNHALLNCCSECCLFTAGAVLSVVSGGALHAGCNTPAERGCAWQCPPDHGLLSMWGCCVMFRTDSALVTRTTSCALIR